MFQINDVATAYLATVAESIPTQGSPALTQDPACWESLVTFDLLGAASFADQDCAGERLGSVASIASTMEGDERALSALRLAGFDDEAVDGPAESFDEPLGSPFEPELGRP